MVLESSFEPLFRDDTLKVGRPKSACVHCPSEDCTIPIDMILQSGDGIRFGAHKKNLQFFGLPLVEKTDNIVQSLPQKGVILELLLRFMHNAALFELWKECGDLDIDDLLAFMDAAENYGVFIAVQAGEEELLARADEMSHEVLLKVLLREASRPSSNIIDEFARRTLIIPTRDVLLFLKDYPQIYMTWSLYRTEWKTWKKEYEMTSDSNFKHRDGRTPKQCTDYAIQYRQKFRAWLRKVEEFPTVDHFTRAEVLFDKFNQEFRILGAWGGKDCPDCNSFELWKTCLMTLFGRQKRWVDCILN